MGLDATTVGLRGDSETVVVEAEAAIAYANATNDEHPSYLNGTYAPPVYAVVPGSELLWALSRRVIPEELMATVLHGEQDMVFHLPLRPGMELTVTPEVYAIKVAPGGARLVFKITSTDEAGNAVVDVYNTVVVRGVTEGESGGPDKPGHRFPDEARSRRVASYSVHVDEDQTHRYAKAGADPNPIHLDADLARQVGLPGIIAHGLCTMAMCSQAVVRTVAGGDPARLRRLAVRFAKPVFPGNDVATSIYEVGGDGGARTYAFEAESGGELVIKDGLAEVVER